MNFWDFLIRASPITVIIFVSGWVIDTTGKPIDGVGFLVIASVFYLLVFYYLHKIKLEDDHLRGYHGVERK